MLKIPSTFIAIGAMAVVLQSPWAWADPAELPDETTPAVVPVVTPRDISPTFDEPPLAEPAEAAPHRAGAPGDEHGTRHGRRGPEAEADTPVLGLWLGSLDLDQRLVSDGASAVETLGPLPGDHLRERSPAQNEYRTRVGGRLQWHGDDFIRTFDGRFEADLRFWDRGDPALADGPLLVRRAGIELTTTVGRFTLGRTTANWGLGIVAQDGIEDPMQFGLRRGGHIVTRLGYALLPAAFFQGGDPAKAFPLALAVAYDWVARDDLAYFTGDSAHNAILALVYQGKQLHAGLYGALRDQRDSLGLATDAQVVDGFVRWRRDGRHGGWFALAAEGVMVRGSTGWLKTIDHPDGLDIAQLGGVARLELGHRRWAARLEGGVASADGRPLDGTLRNFRFARDYHVGLVLFPQVQRLTAERAAANLGNPLYVQSAPAGVERLRTEGAVTQAQYLHPVLRVEATRFLAVMVGGLWAQSPADVADPFRTWLAGGKPTGPRGASGSRDLGLEFDGSVEAHGALTSWLSAALRLDAGVWLPGAAFDDADGQPMGAVGAWQGSVVLRTAL